MHGRTTLVVAYLLFGPGQFVLQLFLLIKKSLVLSAQRRETRGQLVRELGNVPLRLIAHGCVSRKQEWRCGSKSLGRDQLRLRGKEAALLGRGRIGGRNGRVKKRDCQARPQSGKARYALLSTLASEVVPWAVRQACASTFGLGLRSFLRDPVYLYSMPSIP